MNIVRIVPGLDFGGVEQRIVHTVAGFRDFSSHSLRVMVLGNEGKVSRELMHGGVEIIHFHERIKIPNIRLIFRLYRVIREIRPDVVHTSASEANFHGLIAAKLARVPVCIGEEIGFPNHNWKWQKLFKLIYRLADRVIAISYSVKSKIVALGEVEGIKVEVVNNPVGLLAIDSGRDVLTDSAPTIYSKFGTDRIPRECISPNSKNSDRDPPKEFIFLTVCRLVAIKNLETLIHVFSSLSDDIHGFEPRLWIVGDGVERDRLESLSNDLSLRERVVFWGFQSGVRSFFDQADCFVLPSYSEGFSISLVEAMLSRLPCIVTNQGGPAEIIEDGVTGYLIDPHDSQSIKEKMVNVLMTSRRERLKMGERAKQSGSKYSVENYIKRLEEVYSCR